MAQQRWTAVDVESLSAELVKARFPDGSLPINSSCRHELARVALAWMERVDFGRMQARLDGAILERDMAWDAHAAACKDRG